LVYGYSGEPASLDSANSNGIVITAQIENEEVWKLLEAAGAAQTLAESTQLFQEAGVLINQDWPRIPILHAPPVYAQQKALTGWLPNPTSGESWATIFIEK